MNIATNVELKQASPKQTEKQQTVKSSIPYSQTSGGWSLKQESSRRIGVNSNKLNSNEPNSRPNNGLKNKSSALLKRSVQPQVPTAVPVAKWVEHQWLSASQVDILVEQETDWISLLPQQWDLNIETLSLPGIKMQKRAAWQPALRIYDVVKLTQPADYTAVAFPNTTWWSYTACLYLPTLGRVRLIVCFQSNDQREQPTVLVTNRLDWSPRKVISQCVLLGGWPRFW